MPGMYSDGDYDLAGFAVGAVERSNLLDGTQPRAGDILLGLASSGVHSNGLSLVRRVVEGVGLAYGAPCPFEMVALGEEPAPTLGDVILEPTRIYVKACLAALATGGVTGFCHITGGGLIENPPRTFDVSLAARIDVSAWTLPPVFRWLAKTGRIEAPELARTFNCGIGMLVITREKAVNDVIEALTQAGETVHRLGQLEPRRDGGPAVFLDNLARWSA
jgi:phosphoribosylformylglycinamidine cyclo-ligase